jgi:hypothetical protein
LNPILPTTLKLKKNFSSWQNNLTSPRKTLKFPRRKETSTPQSRFLRLTPKPKSIYLKTLDLNPLKNHNPTNQ